MIKKHYSGSARRARNIIWNAAGRYDFDPPFMAFFPNGDPDHYFNMMVGLMDKWLDTDRLSTFFESYDRARRRDEYDEYLWLGLENCLYEKEAGERPVLTALRKERAERFFREQLSLSRQQMEYQSMPVYNQQEARWTAVLGKRPPLLSPREKRISEALRFSGELDTDGVIAAMTDFLKEYFRFDIAAPTQKPVRRAGALARIFLKKEHQRVDRLIVRAGGGEGDHERAVQQRHEGLGRHTGPTEDDTAYIEAVFGKNILTETEMRILENELCTGIDADCRLHISKPSRRASSSEDHIDQESSGPAAAPEQGKTARLVRDTDEDIRKQIARNRAFCADHAAEIRHAVRDLSTRIDTILSSYQKHMPEPSRAGRIRPEIAYRLPVLDDARVFLKDGEETESEIAVDLLLDASQSRMHSQEIISSEAYVIAESLVRLNIPVRITAFRSLRSYTVMEILKEWNTRDADGVRQYFAGGWNRDALALKTLHRMEDPHIAGKQRMILILTDASPNDSTPIAGEGLRLSREYEGAAAVKAAEDAVRLLRHEGCKVGAVFLGNTGHLDDLHEIYGHSCVRIRTISQLAQGVSDLLLMLLREVRND